MGGATGVLVAGAKYKCYDAVSCVAWCRDYCNWINTESKNSWSSSYNLAFGFWLLAPFYPIVIDLAFS